MPPFLLSQVAGIKAAGAKVWGPLTNVVTPQKLFLFVLFQVRRTPHKGIRKLNVLPAENRDGAVPKPSTCGLVAGSAGIPVVEYFYQHQLDVSSGLALLPRQ